MDLIKNILTFDDSFENYNLHGGTEPTAAKEAAPAPAKEAPAPAKGAAAPSKEAPAAPAPAAPGTQAPAKEVPAKASPAKASPAKGAPANGAPAKASPAKAVPAKGAPAAAPAKEAAPAKDGESSSISSESLNNTQKDLDTAQEKSLGSAWGDMWGDIINIVKDVYGGFKNTLFNWILVPLLFGSILPALPFFLVMAVMFSVIKYLMGFFRKL
jgi:hypothetical protein